MHIRKCDTKPRVGDITKANVLKYTRLVGIEFESYIVGEHGLVEQNLPEGYGACVDHSLRDDNYGWEIQTPPASADQLEYYIKQTCAALAMGQAHVRLHTGQPRTGLHIHLDGTGFVDEQTNAIRLTNTYFVLEPVLWALLPQSRRNRGFCTSLTSRISDQDYRRMLRTQVRKDVYYLHKQWYKHESVAMFKKLKDKGYNYKGQQEHRYFGFNLAALLVLGHLELRYHSGTINPDKVRNWIWLHLLILDWVQNHYSRRAIEQIRKAETATDKTALFIKHFKVPEHLVKYMAYRIAQCENPKYYEHIDDISYSDRILATPQTMDAEIDRIILDNN